MQLLSIALSLLVVPIITPAVGQQSPIFENEIAPLLIKRCVECHQGKQPSGNLLLTTGEGLLKGGDSGAVINIDSPAQSNLLQRIHDGEMPPE
jgi:hypothetical protein